MRSVISLVVAANVIAPGLARADKAEKPSAADVIDVVKKFAESLKAGAKGRKAIAATIGSSLLITDVLFWGEGPDPKSYECELRFDHPRGKDAIVARTALTQLLDCLTREPSLRASFDLGAQWHP